MYVALQFFVFSFIAADNEKSYPYFGKYQICLELFLQYLTK